MDRDLDRAALASRPGRLVRLALSVLVLAFALAASGCQFLQNEFYYLDRAQPAPPEQSAGESVFGGG